MFLSGVMYPIHPRCRTSAASSAAAFVRTQETAATFPRNNLKQNIGTNRPKTEATDNLWGFWKTSKTLPQHHILPKAKLLFKSFLSISNTLFLCSGLEQSPQPTVRTQVTGCKTLILHTDASWGPNLWLCSVACFPGCHAKQSGKEIEKKRL